MTSANPIENFIKEMTLRSMLHHLQGGGGGDGANGVAVADTSPAAEAMLQKTLGLSLDDRLCVPGGVGTVLGMDPQEPTSAMVVDCVGIYTGHAYLTLQHMTTYGIRPVTEEERAFLAVATTHETGNNSTVLLDTRPDCHHKQGAPLLLPNCDDGGLLRPQDRVMVAITGLATFIGIAMDGTLFFKSDTDGKIWYFESLDKRPEIIFRATAEDVARAAGCVRFKTIAEVDILLDVRPEAVRCFGFEPGQRVWTPNDFATVIGVDPHWTSGSYARGTEGSGPLFFRWDGYDVVSVWKTCRTREDFVQEGIRPLTAAEQDFCDHAKPFPLEASISGSHAKRREVLLDVRPEAVRLAQQQQHQKVGGGGGEGVVFEPGQRVLTPTHGVATVVGVDGSGTLYFTLPSTYGFGGYKNGVVAFPPFTPFTPLTAHVTTGDNVTSFVDVRPEATQDLGIVPGQRFTAPDGDPATVLGLDMGGDILMEYEGEVFALDGVRTLAQFKAVGFTVPSSSKGKRGVGASQTNSSPLTAADEAFLKAHVTSKGKRSTRRGVGASQTAPQFNFSLAPPFTNNGTTPTVAPAQPKFSFSFGKQ